MNLPRHGSMRGDLCAHCSTRGDWALVVEPGQVAARSVRLCPEHRLAASAAGSLVDLVDLVHDHPGLTAAELGALRPEVTSISQRLYDLHVRHRVVRRRRGTGCSGPFVYFAS